MLEALFNPGAIAVVGASSRPGKVGHAVLSNLLSGGFKGRIVPVNPKADEIRGVPCIHGLKELDGTIDLSVITVPPEYALQAVRDSIDAKAKAVILITAGFKETGPEGAEKEREIAEHCRARKVRLMGPNCLGLVNTHNGMNASFASQMPPAGGISVISQSGALCTSILDWSVGANIGLAKLISFGNKAGLTEVDFLNALARDEETKVIVGYLESIDHGDEFIKAAEAAAAVKPVVIMKVGTTAAGAKAASSHTGSLVGTDTAYGAAFARAGVIRAETFESLLDFATALSTQPLPAGRRVAVLTNAGGPGIMAADRIENAGLRAASLNEETSRKLAEMLPAAASVGNPIDVLGDASPERYAKAAELVVADDGVDALCVILTPQAMSDPSGTAKAVASAVETAGKPKPVTVSFMGGSDIDAGRTELAKSGLPEYPSPERAVDALKAMADYAAWRNRPQRVVTRFAANRRRVSKIIARHLRMERLNVGEAKAKAILSAYDFIVPAGDLAVSAEEAVETAARIGFPVAMKISSPQVIHKSDVGGVRLDLAGAGAVRDAFDLMMLRVAERVPGAEIEGVYIEQMCSKGREVIIGMSRDPQFGPMLMFGLGGIFVEVLKDVTFHLAPITHEEAMQMLTGTRSYSLLTGVRGQTGVDMAAIGSGLQRISQLVTDFPQIAELDINPFIVGEPGTPPVAADARITLYGEQR